MFTIAISGNSPRQEITFHPPVPFSPPLPQGHGTKSTLNFDRLVCRNEENPRGKQRGVEKKKRITPTPPPCEYRKEVEERRVNSQGKGIHSGSLSWAYLPVSSLVCFLFSFCLGVGGSIC
ncbi:hypothetical protein CDAR_189491 [Caerostris darwini]|uniref:Transmembrane protein n=1 Tax=Caerostris darwini TaxID=1538125 RepID=A0AAV4QUD6_9ARAC|nr:hypothetical protein CDAR_189491 [Caerostris darwini]